MKNYISYNWNLGPMIWTLSVTNVEGEKPTLNWRCHSTTNQGFFFLIRTTNQVEVLKVGKKNEINKKARTTGWKQKPRHSMDFVYYKWNMVGPTDIKSNWPIEIGWIVSDEAQLQAVWWCSLRSLSLCSSPYSRGNKNIH